MSFDPYAPYGPVVASAIRVVTWNVWGRYSPDREARQAALEEACRITSSWGTGRRRTGYRASVSCPGGR
jgi:hypothetical protein